MLGHSFEFFTENKRSLKTELPRRFFEIFRHLFGFLSSDMRFIYVMNSQTSNPSIRLVHNFSKIINQCTNEYSNNQTYSTKYWYSLQFWKLNIIWIFEYFCPKNFGTLVFKVAGNNRIKEVFFSFLTRRYILTTINNYDNFMLVSRLLKHRVSS